MSSLEDRLKVTSVLEVDRKSDKAAEAYARHDFAAAISLMNEVISLSPGSPHGVASRHLRAMAYESGNVPGGVSLEGALADFLFLSERSEAIGSVGLIGAARVLMKIDPAANFDRVEELCRDALALDAPPEAELLLGDLSAKVKRDENSARKHYRRAYRKGSSAGLLSIAGSHERQGNRLRAAFFAFLFGLKS